MLGFYLDAGFQIWYEKARNVFYEILPLHNPPALIVSPTFAEPLTSEDWTETPYDNGKPCFTFVNGTMIAAFNTSGAELYYKVEESTKPMVNGSGLSITLQFNAASFLADENTGLYVCFKHNNAMGGNCRWKSIFS